MQFIFWGIYNAFEFLNPTNKLISLNLIFQKHYISDHSVNRQVIVSAGVKLT